MDERQIVERIGQIDKELKDRAENDHLSSYNRTKKHKKQIAFHKCKKRNRWVFGGNRSGKTECGAVECVYMARGIHPYRKNRKNVSGWVVSLSQQVQRDVAQKKVLYYLRPDWVEEIVMLSGRRDSPESGIIDFIKIKNVLGGSSVIGFKSCDQGREKFQGSSLDFVWFDEEPPKDIYDECRMRVLDRRGDLFGTMTPLKGLTFLYDEIYLNTYNNREVWYEFMEWGDNPYLSKNEIKLLESSMDENTLQSRKYGKFAVGEGMVYPEFDERMTTEKVKDFFIRNVGYFIVAIVSLVYIATALIAIDETGKSVGQIIADGAIVFFLGFFINRVFDLQGIMNGDRDERVVMTMNTHGETVVKISPYIDRLDEWCKLKNSENLKIQRTRILASEGMKYSDYFNDDGSAKDFKIDENKLKNKILRKSEKRRIACFNKALHLKLTPLSAGELTSESAKKQDPYYFGRTKEEYEKQTSIVDIRAK